MTCSLKMKTSLTNNQMGSRETVWPLDKLQFTCLSICFVYLFTVSFIMVCLVKCNCSINSDNHLPNLFLYECFTLYWISSAKDQESVKAPHLNTVCWTFNTIFEGKGKCAMQASRGREEREWALTPVPSFLQ